MALPNKSQQNTMQNTQRRKTYKADVERGVLRHQERMAAPRDSPLSYFLPGYPKTWAEKQLVLDSQTEMHKQSRIKKQRERLAAPYLSALDNIQEDEEE